MLAPALPLLVFGAGVVTGVEAGVLSLSIVSVSCWLLHAANAAATTFWHSTHTLDAPVIGGPQAPHSGKPSAIWLPAAKQAGDTPSVVASSLSHADRSTTAQAADVGAAAGVGVSYIYT